MLQIAIQPVPSQRLIVVLAGQNVQIAINTKTTGLFVDINVNSVDVATGVLVRNGIALNTRPYSGSFAGQLYMIDTQGSDDPTYDGLGTRYVLIYLTASEYAAI